MTDASESQTQAQTYQMRPATLPKPETPLEFILKPKQGFDEEQQKRLDAWGVTDTELLEERLTRVSSPIFGTLWAILIFQIGAHGGYFLTATATAMGILAASIWAMAHGRARFHQRWYERAYYRRSQATEKQGEDA